MLCNRIDVDGVAPQKEKSIELGFYNLKNEEWHRIGESDSWNWQQGAMLQWIPGVGNENKVIYNTSHNNKLISIIHDIETGIDKQINWPIYGLTPDGKKSITIDLERSYWCRAYHYQSVVNHEKEGRVYNEDGIFEVDLEINEVKRILSIQQIINADYQEYFETCKHWLEHIMINPSGTKICFLHRFSPENNVYNYQTRLCIADINGDNLQVVPGWDKMSVSHFGWKSDDEFVIYTVLNTPISSATSAASDQTINLKVKSQLICLLRSIVPQTLKMKIRAKSKGYFYYTITSGKIQLLAKWQGKNLDIDGHPSFTSDGRYMITDSYPAPNGFQRLLVYDTQTNRSLVLAKIYASFNNNPASCDLHPKMCKDNNFLAVDTAYDKLHHLILFKINWELINKYFEV